MKFLVLSVIAFAICITALDHDVFGDPECEDPSCHVLEKTSRSSPIQGIQFDLDAPDIWVDRTMCDNTAVSAGWLVANPRPMNSNHAWAESGITKGDFRNVGCVTLLSTYYTLNNVNNDNNPVYQQYLIPNGRVDPGNKVHIILKETDLNQIQITVTTPHRISTIPIAQVGFHPDNVYFGDIGIEGTISAPNSYSSIPMSKFYNMKIFQSGSWITPPSSATIDDDDADHGYIGEKCTNGAFIAGTVTEIDCYVVAIRNQIPTPERLTRNIATNDTLTIDLHVVDTDNDYLKYTLVGLPSHGIVSGIAAGQQIPNTDGDSAQLMYTPYDAVPMSDFITYSVTDGRTSHARDGTISLIGPQIISIPDAIDDFAFSLTGNTIHFTWSHPDDNGSAITYYKVERSNDATTWGRHDSYNSDTTAFDYTRQPGYDGYFRVLAYNDIGNSISNIIHVHIPDTTPPVITINEPFADAVITTPYIHISGYIREEQNTGIENVAVMVDNVARSEQIDLDIISIDVSVGFETDLLEIPNGNHIITVTADNRDGLTGSSSVAITVDSPIPTLIDSFSDTFETDMSNWFLATEDDENWSVRNPQIPVPDFLTGNKVAGTEDCDNICTMRMVDYVDLTAMASPTLSFDRFVGTNADISDREGIVAYVSEDAGVTWSVLERFTADEFDDDGVWHREEYDLAGYSASSQFQIRFDAVSSSNSEDTELDNVLIYDEDAVTDTEPPVIIAPPDMSFTTTDMSITLTESDYGTANVTDDTDPSPMITNNATNPFLIGTTTILWTATDDADNFATDTQLITVIFSSLTITAPPDMTVEADHVNNIINIGNASAMHDTDTYIIISNDAPSSFRVGTTTVVTWTATDSTGVMVTAMQIITVQDTTDPVFDPVQDLDFVFDPGVPLVIDYDYPVATDLDNLTVGVACTPASGTIFNEGSNTVTCTATDDAGNTADITFSINVLVYDSTIFFDGFDGFIRDNWISPQFSFWSTAYNVPVTIPGHDSSNTIAHASGCNFAGGCVMELTDGLDLSNHTDSEFLQFYRYLDPRLENGDYLKLEAYGSAGWDEMDIWTLENSDNDGAWHLEEYDLAIYTGASDFKLRFTAVADGGVDEFGIDAVKIFKVPEPVSNVTALSITAPPDITAEADGILTVVDIGTVLSPDNNITITNDAPEAFNLGNTTVTWTAAGNGTTATDIQIITVQDTTAPMFGTVSNVSVTAASNVASVVVDYDVPTATDVVDSSVDVACTPAPRSVFDVGTTHVLCTATDDYDNVSYASFVVDVLFSTIGTGTFPFFDDFEDGIMDGWDVSLDSFWAATALYDPVYPPDHASTNKAAVAALCYDAGGCIMSLSSSIDLASNGDATLQFYRYVDSSLDAGEFLKVEVYDGIAWAQLDVWTPENSDDDGAWHLEEYSLAAYADVADFNVRFVSESSSFQEEVGIDDVSIFVQLAS